MPPAPDGAGAAGAAPADEEGGAPLCLQVDNQHIADSLVCSPAHSLPIIHSAPHLHLRPLTTHCLPDSHSIPGTSWAPSSYPFRSPTSYSSYLLHCDKHSAQISTSLAWVSPEVPHLGPGHALLLPAQSFPFSMCGIPLGPTRHTQLCNQQGREHQGPGGTLWTMEYGSHWVNVLPLGRQS